MPPIDAENLSVVIDALRLERAELLSLLESLDPGDWELPTECPLYSVAGVATHVLGDDLSLLSRQRDEATPGLIHVAEKMPGADFRQLLDGFNDQWVEAARFFSPTLLIDLLRFSGDRSLVYYEAVDPSSPGEPVGLFAAEPGQGSPFWHAIAREYLERWVHHSQIRRALGKPSLAGSPFLEVGIRIVATAGGMTATEHEQTRQDRETASRWSIDTLDLGDRQVAADILTLAHTEDEVRELIDGPESLVAAFSSRVSRRA